MEQSMDRFSDFRPFSKPMNAPNKKAANKPVYGPENPYANSAATNPMLRPRPAQPVVQSAVSDGAQAAINQLLAPERVDPRLAKVREARQRLEAMAERTRQGTADMVRAAQNPTPPVASGPNPYMAPFASVNAANERQAGLMQQRREAAEAAVRSPSTVPYGARNVYSPLDGRAEAFRRMTPAPVAAPAPKQVTQKDIAEKEMRRFQAGKQTNPEYVVGNTPGEQANLAAKYGVYLRGAMLNPVGTRMTMAEFADAYRSGSPEATAPINAAMIDAANRRAAVANAKAEGLRNRQAAAAFQAYGAIPAGMAGERFLTGYAARMNPFATPEMSMNLADNAAKERIAAGNDATQLGVAGINADATMYDSDNRTSASMYSSDATAFSNAYTADAQLAAETSRIAAEQEREAAKLGFTREQWEAGQPEREIAAKQAQMEYDAKLAEQRRLQDPQTAADQMYMDVIAAQRDANPNATEIDMRLMQQRALEQAQIVFAQKLREQTLGSNPLQAPGPQAEVPQYAPPSLTLSNPSKPVTEGASKGLMTAEGLSKYVADWIASNNGKKPTPEAIANSLRRDGYSLNEETLLNLRRNMDAYNEGGWANFGRRWTQGWLENTGTRDPLAQQAYNAMVPGAVGTRSALPLSPYSMFDITQRYQDAAREEEYLRRYGFR
jgi:hypothetical protein